MESFEYIDRSGLEHFRFYRIPKILIEDEFFRDLSTDAKLLYGFYHEIPEIKHFIPSFAWYFFLCIAQGDVPLRTEKENTYCTET